MYAAILHENAILQKAYAFGYDDVCEQSSVGITKNPPSWCSQYIQLLAE
jgi:hypothetical protein